MSDKMTPIPLSKLMEWILAENKTTNTLFGIHRAYKADQNKVWQMFGAKLEMPFGPAAGPHTQLAQNLVAAYYAGSRFFELKTVQVLDGEDLAVPKPCIKADDEGYNVEWSTELYIPQAFNEYVKAWFAIQVIAKEFQLGAMNGFQFNMSVGYDLAGIKTEKIDKFIEGMKDASQTAIFQECRQWLMENVELFERLTLDDIKSISPHVCSSATLSTLHGCPPQEIERIANYLLEEKQVNTFIKCNPTLLGYEYVRNILDEMGYDYVIFDDFHFKDDLQYDDAVALIKRLMQVAEKQKLEFGVKLTNTLPVDIKAQELPGNEMYMSGRALYPLSISLAAKLSLAFNGKLRLSFSGGADYFNIKKIVAAGIWPVTMATTMLKPGGYQRLEQIAQLFGSELPQAFNGVDTNAIAGLVEQAKFDKHNIKPIKQLPSRKLLKQVPLIDCFMAPCQEGCPIHQDITNYMKLASEGKMKEALQVIIEKNPLPFITGTICSHNCMNKCTRNFYETPVNIRRTKLEAAYGGFEELLKELKMPVVTSTKNVAVVGGGPAGLAAAYFLAKGKMAVTIFEKRESLGGVVSNVIPDFRISKEAIANDIKLIKAMGVQVVTGKEISSVQELKEDYDYVVLAVGATKHGVLCLEQGNTINAMDFLEAFSKKGAGLNIGKHVVVIGGGNTAMDTARAAKRVKGVEDVSLIYRRTRRYMPADEEELLMALEDGVGFLELMAPVSLEKAILTCKKMQLGEPDAAGRCGVVPTEELTYVKADTVIAAVGEQVCSQFYTDNGIGLDGVGQANVNEETLATDVHGVYVIGDGLYGPSTVVEAIRDARKAAEAILKMPIAKDYDNKAELDMVYARKGKLVEEDKQVSDGTRCLNCNAVCENCVEACPNRANISVHVPALANNQIIHIDYMCNECGNCKTFCPYESAPYLDKFTLFANEPDMANSKNNGFTVLDKKTGACKIRLNDELVSYTPGENVLLIHNDITLLIEAVIKSYLYLF